MESRITRWKRATDPDVQQPDLEEMARVVATRLENTFGKELLQGPFLDEILSKARDMIADQIEESVGAAMFEPDLVVIDDEEEEEELPPSSEGKNLQFPDFAEVARRIRERKLRD